MADFPYYPFPSPPPSSSSSKKSPTSYLLGFTAFASKAFSDAEPAMSPTSILDTKPFKNPVWTEPGSGVGLGIVDSLTDDDDEAESEPGSARSKKKLIVAKKPANKTKFAIFGSQLKIQIPSPQNTFSLDSQNTPVEFGIKTRNSQLGFVASPKCSSGSPSNFHGSISSAEMELSEDYTCVISRGGHVTKMTRIFDDCIVDSYFGDPGVSSSSSSVNRDENGVSVSPYGSFGCQFESFLSFCHTCRKSLDQGNDIYMLRGEKAFCSDECRYREILMEEEMEKNGVLGEDDLSSW
ncbi:hypothetical protein V2J09_014222 [Rumex salicifolius]